MRYSRALSLLVAVGIAGVGGVNPLRAERDVDDRPLASLENTPGSNGPNGAAAGAIGANESEPAKPALKGNPLWAIPLRTLSATRERPLFSPSRRPPAPVAAAAAAAPPPQMAVKPAEPERPPLALVGTIISENEKLAIFFNQATRAVTRVREGEKESGWLVRTVGQRATILEKDNQTVILNLPKRSDDRPNGLPAATPQAGDNL